MNNRLPAHVEAGALIRRVEAEGGSAAVLKKGDPDRGALTLIVRERGEFRGILERELGSDFEYRWKLKKADEPLSSESLAVLIADKQRFDADFWLIELDTVAPERFIAETIGLG